MTDRRRRLVPELVERDLEGVPSIALAAMLSLFDQVEAYRPLLPEEQSTRLVVEQVREGRNQLLEERFGRGEALRSGRHPAARSVPRQHQEDRDADGEAD